MTTVIITGRMPWFKALALSEIVRVWLRWSRADAERVVAQFTAEDRPIVIPGLTNDEADEVTRGVIRAGAICEHQVAS